MQCGPTGNAVRTDASPHADLPLELLRRIMASDSALTTVDIVLRENFDEAGCNILARALSCNTCITSLNLHGTKINATGASLIFPAISHLTALTYLDLRRTGCEALIACELFRGLKHLTTLTELGIGHPLQSADDACRLLHYIAEAGMSQLTLLNMCRHSIGDIASCNTWRELSLPQPPPHFLHAKNNTLLLRFLVCVDRPTFAAANHPDLPQQLLQRITASDPALAKLELKELSHLKEAGCSILARALSCNTCITSLNFYQSCFGDEGASLLFPAITHLTALTYLDLSFTRIKSSCIPELCCALTHLTALACLSLAFTQVQSSGVPHVCAALQRLPALAELYLGHTEITADHAARVICAAAAAGLTCLKTLRLGANGFSVSDVVACESWQQLSMPQPPHHFVRVADSALPSPDFTALYHFVVSSDSGAFADSYHPEIPQQLLQRVVANDANLTSLVIAHKANFDEAGCSILARALSCNTCITSLNLHGTKINATGASLIFPAISHLTALTYLDLRDTGLESPAVPHLCNALSQLTAVACLYLGRTSLTANDIARVCFAAAAARLARLKTLYVDFPLSTVILCFAWYQPSQSHGWWCSDYVVLLQRLVRDDATAVERAVAFEDSCDYVSAVALHNIRLLQRTFAFGPAHRITEEAQVLFDSCAAKFLFCYRSSLTLCPLMAAELGLVRTKAGAFPAFSKCMTMSLKERNKASARGCIGVLVMRMSAAAGVQALAVRKLMTRILKRVASSAFPDPPSFFCGE